MLCLFCKEKQKMTITQIKTNGIPASGVRTYEDDYAAKIDSPVWILRPAGEQAPWIQPPFKWQAIRFDLAMDFFRSDIDALAWLMTLSPATVITAGKS